MFVRGCVKFVTAVAYLLCLALPGSCLARFAFFLANLCIRNVEVARNQVFPMPATFSNEAELVVPTSNQFSVQSSKVIK